MVRMQLAILLGSLLLLFLARAASKSREDREGREDREDREDRQDRQPRKARQSREGREKKQIYLAGTFPINGSEGWQGGQVKPCCNCNCSQICCLHPNFGISAVLSECVQELSLKIAKKISHNFGDNFLNTLTHT